MLGFPTNAPLLPFLCRMTASLSSTLRGAKFLFDFLNMRKQTTRLLIGALALVVVITGCGNAESAKSLGKKADSEDDAAQFFKLGMEFFKLGMEYWSSGDTPKATEANLAAIECFRKAAEQGNGLAQMRIGDKYYHGTGVPQNDVEAYAWFLLAKTRGYGDGLFGLSFQIEKLEERMTSNQRAQGQARALELPQTIRERLDELQKQGTGNEEPY